MFGPETFKLPALGFSKDALAPGIDAETMDIHHGKHHAGYVRKLNAALDGTSSSTDGSLESLLAEVASDNAALRNNGGGHFNHTPCTGRCSVQEVLQRQREIWRN